MIKFYVTTFVIFYRCDYFLIISLFQKDSRFNLATKNMVQI